PGGCAGARRGSHRSAPPMSAEGSASPRRAGSPTTPRDEAGGGGTGATTGTAALPRRPSGRPTRPCTGRSRQALFSILLDELRRRSSSERERVQRDVEWVTLRVGDPAFRLESRQAGRRVPHQDRHGHTVLGHFHRFPGLDAPEDGAGLLTQLSYPYPFHVLQSSTCKEGL